MKIEQAIKQSKPFKNAQTKALVNMVYTYMWVRDNQKEYFKPFGITMQQYNILRILKGAEGPISTADIKDRMLDRASDASRVVDRLEKKKLVTKAVCESDQRKVDVSINKQGIELLNAIGKGLDNWQKKLINLSVKEANQLSDLLDKLRN